MLALNSDQIPPPSPARSLSSERDVSGPSSPKTHPLACGLSKFSFPQLNATVKISEGNNTTGNRLIGADDDTINDSQVAKKIAGSCNTLRPNSSPRSMIAISAAVPSDSPFISLFPSIFFLGSCPLPLFRTPSCPSFDSHSFPSSHSRALLRSCSQLLTGLSPLFDPQNHIIPAPTSTLPTSGPLANFTPCNLPSVFPRLPPSHHLFNTHFFPSPTATLCFAPYCGYPLSMASQSSRNASKSRSINLFALNEGCQNGKAIASSYGRFLPSNFIILATSGINDNAHYPTKNEANAALSLALNSSNWRTCCGHLPSLHCTADIRPFANLGPQVIMVNASPFPFECQVRLQEATAVPCAIPRGQLLAIKRRWGRVKMREVIRGQADDRVAWDSSTRTFLPAHEPRSLNPLEGMRKKDER